MQDKSFLLSLPLGSVANLRCSLPVRCGTQASCLKVSSDAPALLVSSAHTCLLIANPGPAPASTRQRGALACWPQTPYTCIALFVVHEAKSQGTPPSLPSSFKALPGSLQGGDSSLVSNYLFTEPCSSNMGTRSHQRPTWDLHGTRGRPSNWVCHRNAQESLPPGSLPSSLTGQVSNSGWMQQRCPTHPRELDGVHLPWPPPGLDAPGKQGSLCQASATGQPPSLSSSS